MNLSLLAASLLSLVASCFLVADIRVSQRGRNYRLRALVLFVILACLSVIDIYRGLGFESSLLSSSWDWLSFYYVIGSCAFFYRENRRRCFDCGRDNEKN